MVDETEILTPEKVERKLYHLSLAIDKAHKELSAAEKDYLEKKADLEIALAKSRIKNSHPDMRMTASLREDQALIENEQESRALAIAEIVVRASRANVKRLETQVDIARSLGTSVRASMEVI